MNASSQRRRICHPRLQPRASEIRAKLGGCTRSCGVDRELPHARTGSSNPSTSSGESRVNHRFLSVDLWHRQGPDPNGSLAARSEARDDQEATRGELTMTSRVTMVSLEHACELGEAMGLPARGTQSEAFRVLANNPGVARVAYGQLIQLLENNKLDTRLRELMIMRIGWVTGSAYEWTQHWRVATTAGIPPEDIVAVRDWRTPSSLTPADKAVLAATDECLAGKSISDAAWAEVVKHVTDPGQQVEFIIAMGNWMMFSLLFRNLRIPLAEGLMVWPPDGLTSPAAPG
jgi:alkylhydroperoxidase family enzyme